MTIAALGGMSVRRPSSSLATRDDINQLGDFAALLALVAGRDRILDAMRRMVGENFLFGSPQCSAYGRKLRDNIDAIAILIDHARKPAHLSLDPPQAF
jgi:hypothetical protein